MGNGNILIDKIINLIMSGDNGKSHFELKHGPLRIYFYLFYTFRRVLKLIYK